jgi:hypothetical protein
MKSLAAGVIGLLLATGVASAQTPTERAVILRDFERSVAEWAMHTATQPPPIFTPPVAMVFRQLIAGALARVDADCAMSGAGMPAHRVRVLEPLAADAGGVVAPLVAGTLPALPDDLEYRFIDNDLVLRDRVNGIVVAVLKNAVGVAAMK